MMFGLENLYIFGEFSDFHDTSRLSLSIIHKMGNLFSKIFASQWQYQSQTV